MVCQVKGFVLGHPEKPTLANHLKTPSRAVKLSYLYLIMRIPFGMQDIEVDLSICATGAPVALARDTFGDFSRAPGTPGHAAQVPPGPNNNGQEQKVKY